MTDFYTLEEIENIIAKGGFEISETARPAFDERVEAAAGACVEAADRQLDARLLRKFDAKVGRELKKLTSLTKRFQRFVGDGPIQKMLNDGPTSRMKMRGSPKLLHDKPYLELLSSMGIANASLEEVQVRIKVAEQSGKRHPIRALVERLALIWEDYKGEPVRFGVDFSTSEVEPHPFFKLAHACAAPLRQTYSGIPKFTRDGVRQHFRHFQKERNKPENVSERAALVRAREKLASFDLIEKRPTLP